MHLFEFPVELFRSIMEAAVCSSVQQAMQARLVCKTFNTQLVQAIYTTRILESPEWEKRPIDPSVLAGYLFTRAHSQNPSGYSLIQVIYETVDYLLERTPQSGHSRVEYIRRLCSLATDSYCSEPTIHNVLLSLDWQGQPHRRKYSLTQAALTAAIHCGMSSLAEVMIEDGAKDTMTCFGTSLFCAVKRDDMKLTLLLLEKGGADPTPVEVKQAARNGNSTILELLFDQITAGSPSESSFYVQALEGAAGSGQLDTIHFIVQRAILRNLLENKLDDKDTPPIMVLNGKECRVSDIILLEAILHGQVRLVQVALDYGASPNAESPSCRYSWRNALVSAALKGHEDIVRVLLARMTTKCPYVLRNALFFAVKGGWVQIARVLLDHGAELPTGLRYITRNLLAAVKSGQVDTVKLLIGCKGAKIQADLDVCNEAYLWAVSYGYTSIARCFVEYGLTRG